MPQSLSLLGVLELPSKLGAECLQMLLIRFVEGSQVVGVDIENGQ
jgi:hypothetical protein